MDDQRPNKREEERLLRAIPLTITGTDTDGIRFDETTTTRNISDNGLSVRLLRLVKPGNTLLIKRSNGTLFTATIQ